MYTITIRVFALLCSIENIQDWDEDSFYFQWKLIMVTFEACYVLYQDN
jgi:hypothetical protein